MTYLMVNLEDRADCKRAMMQLRGLVDPGGGCRPRGGPGGRQGRGHGHEHGPNHGRGHRRPGHEGRSDESAGGAEGGLGVMGDDAKAAAIRALPLRAKLERMSQRGVWRHLVAIAKQGDVAKSLAEFDKELDLQPNKMRSLKAIMAKLENRFGLRFLEVDVDAGNDEAGNPRYSMPPRVRNQILRIVDETA